MYDDTYLIDNLNQELLELKKRDIISKKKPAAKMQTLLFMKLVLGCGIR